VQKRKPFAGEGTASMPAASGFQGSSLQQQDFARLVKLIFLLQKLSLFL